MKLRDMCYTARKRGGWSQTEWVKMIGSRQSEISCIERGFIPEDFRKAQKIYELYMATEGKEAEVLDFSDHGEVNDVEEHTSKSGDQYWVINGIAYYPKIKFTLKEAVKDFKSEKSIMERADAAYRAWCD